MKNFNDPTPAPAVMNIMATNFSDGNGAVGSGIAFRKNLGGNAVGGNGGAISGVENPTE